jgi:hypothetical protein
MHPKKPGEGRSGKVVAETGKSTRKKALPEPVLTVEAGPNTRPARPAIISLRLHPESPPIATTAAAPMCGRSTSRMAVGTG